MPYKGVYLIGLTGNIACGKSTVLAMLEDHGAAVIDADQVTRQVQQPGEPVYRLIVETFGDAILVEPGGPIDRQRLGAMVFSDPQALQRLEQIVHPAVHARILAWLDDVATHARVAVIDAVKLLEAGWKPVCDAVWVVTCTPDQQLRRLMGTRGMSESEARMRIAAQPPQESRIAQADVVIDNSGALDATRAQVDAAWARIPLNE
ncbi:MULTISPECIES: dephospho-CoA kinase [Roseiflexus]|jgi:dephospho-CoA kinase|uniref:Dephospho-CoA kinase n=1 Tax=Roseiflexus castenholzii (strain DSM 13941 / HLO8) TaxID=383372 RepID=A7NRL5_ROSCS|nr:MULTISPECIES: dephospho-CoA kinase [Roseiflexus]ABU60211.1 dephospho-CoA kinase [Roseiflexus castenholzii DSM 13941]GIW03107.1 MAG: dephospho-CoA kinase [Roseiflexus sp.]